MLRIAAGAMVFATLVTASASAVSVTDYRTYRDATATTLTGQGTDDPVIGDLSNTANSSFLIGYLPAPVTLGATTGSSITFTFGVKFNDAVGMANAGDNFRFALFDLNGESQDSATGGVSGGPNYGTAGTSNTDDYRGYWFGVRNGTGTGSGGSIRERTGTLVSGQNAFAATGLNAPTAPSLGAVGGDPVTLKSDVNGDGTGATYTGILKLTRNASGLVDLSGSFIGNNAATGNVYAATDPTANLDSTYEAIGFLIGNALSTDQATFSDISVTTAGPSVAGDYNGNGVVDAADYAIWRKNLGGPGGSASVGDSEPDNDVDAADYDFWRSQFGNTSGSGAGANSGAIPEPTSLFLITIASASFLAGGRRRP